LEDADGKPFIEIHQLARILCSARISGQELQRKFSRFRKRA